ncbi:MAG: WbuC family cupin fold metalloprotein [Gammaproteobacteria bacterium]
MKLFADTQLDELVTKAAASPRKRAHLTIHESASDLVQRFFVVARRDSYFRPHAHLSKSELAVVLRGRLDLVTFDEAGHLHARHAVGEGTGQFAFEIDRGTWHTLVPLTDDCAFLEIKEGPYDPAVAVKFAAWAAPEGDSSVPRFQEWLRHAGIGSLYSA